MIDVAFPYRLLLLAAVFVVLALWHFRHDRQRWQEYAFVFLAGSAGGIFGVVNDFVTSAISPFYFEVAKGLGRGSAFSAQVAALGFQAGFVAGALAACALLYANNPRRGVSRIGYQRLSCLAGRSAAIACALALIFAGAAQLVEANPLIRHIDIVVPKQEAHGFLTVAAIHFGLYLGLAVGIIVSMRRVRQLRGVRAVSSLMRPEASPHPPTHDNPHGVGMPDLSPSSDFWCQYWCQLVIEKGRKRP